MVSIRSVVSNVNVLAAGQRVAHRTHKPLARGSTFGRAGSWILRACRHKEGEEYAH